MEKKGGDSLIEGGTSRTPGTEMLSRKMKTSVYMILFIPVVNTADLIEAADHFGWAALTNAAATLAGGQDMEVPEMEGGATGDQAASISTPGAVRSGCTSFIHNFQHKMCSEAYLRAIKRR